MAKFLEGVAKSMPGESIHTAKASTIPSDSAFPYWVVMENHVVGEAKEVEPIDYDICMAFVRLFGMEEFAELGTIAKSRLWRKPCPKKGM